MMKERVKVLLIEDDEDDYVLVRELLSEISFTSYGLEWASTYRTALAAACRGAYDVCLLDFRLGECTGLDLLRELTQLGHRKPIIFLTGQGDHEVDMEAMKLGAADFLVKAELNAPLLERSIRFAIERKRAEEELRFTMAKLQESNHNLSETMEELRTAEEDLHLQYQELLQSQETVQRERRRYLDLFEHAPDGYVVTNSQGIILQANSAAIALLGKGDQFTVGFPLLSFIADHCREEFRQELARLRHPKEVRDWELWFKSFPASVSVATVNPVDGEQVSLRWLIRDITERKTAEEKLVETKAMLQTVVNGISDPLLLLESDLTVKMLNKASCGYFQVADEAVMMGKSYRELSHGIREASDKGEIRSAVAERRSVTFERPGLFDPERCEEITVYPADNLTGGFSGAIVRISDITESKNIEKHLMREDRLSSLGQLSGGIAHEIRNPLAGISLFVDVLGNPDKFSRTAQELNILEEIKSNVHKIDGIIKRVLAFSRHADSNLANLQVKPLIEDTMRLWTSRVKSCGIELKLALEEDLPDVLGDPIEIQQVLNNLVHNALDAMSEGGLLTVTAEKGLFSLDSKRPAVVIKIQDTGCGIPAEQRKYVFNPFFTTKPTGTGLGLAISHRIVSRHRGVLALESASDRGTTFCLELPPAPRG